MRSWLHLSFGIIVLVIWAEGSLAQSESAGIVTRLRGEAFVERNLIRFELHEGSEIFSDDVAITGDSARLEISLNDNSVLTLGDQSTLIIRDFVYDPDTKMGNAFFVLTRGVLRTISGEIAYSQKDNFLVKTTVATIGIRGTDFFVGIIEGKLRVVLLAGTGIYVENASGRVEITEIGSGTTIFIPATAPGESIEMKLREMPETDRLRKLAPNEPAMVHSELLSIILGSVAF